MSVKKCLQIELGIFKLVSTMPDAPPARVRSCPGEARAIWRALIAETPEIVANALRRNGDRGLIRHVELERGHPAQPP